MFSEDVIKYIINQLTDTKNNFLEVGIRINSNMFRYYQISVSSKINLNNIEYNKLTYYDMDINEHIRRKLHQ